MNIQTVKLFGSESDSVLGLAMLAHFDDQVTGHSGSEYTDQHVKFCINADGSAIRISDDEAN